MMPPKERNLPGVPFAFRLHLSETIVNASLSNLSNLQNENPFPSERVLFSNRKLLYAQIPPSLLLTSMRVLDKPQSFNVFIARIVLRSGRRVVAGCGSRWRRRWVVGGCGWWPTKSVNTVYYSCAVIISQLLSTFHFPCSFLIIRAIE